MRTVSCSMAFESRQPRGISKRIKRGACATVANKKRPLESVVGEAGASGRQALRSRRTALA